MSHQNDDYRTELLMTVADLRFWNKVDKTRDCWNWQSAKDKFGYGFIRIKGKNRKAHRVAYTLIKGHIPKGLVIDHLCQNTSCVNPKHLEAVTNKENLLRISIRRHAILGHKPRWSRWKNQNRTCLECKNLRWRAKSL